ncbi:MAG: TIGR03745 family integrating conjugative element membrane protein [Pasteurella oralis]|uniref:TIGR03745 family integrating conjugative element membrane protein n=1 Tax=Pasteurella oralis TaxID=1071947 RepID=UPI00270D1E28|nr:TIGR03745 family integrating conjugative element membrane protein [Pasteurella oralis]
MKKFALNFNKKVSTACSALTLLFISISESFAAGIPKMEAPSKGEGSGFFETIKNYFYDGVTLIVLGLCSWALIKVAYAAMETFGEVRAKKSSWGELAAIVMVGVILVIAVIWLGVKAVDVFA